jgi:hypothetical protein
MPAYFTDVLGFDLASAGVLCVFPYLSLFISSLAFGAIFENLQLHHNWSVDKVRKVSQYIAYAGSTGVLIICGFMDNKYVAYVFMILTQVSLFSLARSPCLSDRVIIVPYGRCQCWYFMCLQ